MDYGPLAYIGATGAVSVIVAVVTNRLTAATTGESEERQAKRRVEEEQRAAIHQIRRDRVQPILDYLELWKQYGLRWALEAITSEIEADPEERDRLAEQLEAVKQATAESTADKLALAKAYFAASSSSTSMPGMRDELDKLLSATAAELNDEKFDEVQSVVRSVENQIENYLMKAWAYPADHRRHSSTT